MSVADAETVISDWQMSIIEGRLRDGFRIPEETEFATFIQPPKYVERGPDDKGYLPAMAVFLTKTPHPTNPAISVVTPGTVELKHYTQSVVDRKHFVSLKEDPAFVIFSAVLKVHLDTLQSMRELIH